MVLSRGDDFPIHQTPEPIAFAGTDRNFYDRYFFNGYAPDGSNFFALAFGVYPHLDLADAHFSFIRDGKQYALHASTHLNMERIALRVGPIAIEVIEPLQRLKVTIDECEGIEGEFTFDGRAFPIAEPRFTHRIGPRAFLGAGLVLADAVEVDGLAHPSLGPIIFSGRTTASNVASSTKPRAIASSLSVVPFLCAVLATVVALS